MDFHLGFSLTQGWPSGLQGPIPAEKSSDITLWRWAHYITSLEAKVDLPASVMSLLVAKTPQDLLEHVVPHSMAPEVDLKGVDRCGNIGCFRVSRGLGLP